MRRPDEWQPSKFEPYKGGWRVTTDRSLVRPGSRFVASRQLDLYSRLLSVHARGDLLDLGCGAVPLYGVYADYVASVTCIDWPNSSHDLRHLDLECDLNDAIPLADNSFDTVLLTDVLEHLYRPLALLTEISRLLRPGGRLILTVPFMYCLHEMPNDYFRFTSVALERMMHESHLGIINTDTYGGSFEVFCDLIEKHLAFIPMLATIHAAIARRVCSLQVMRALGKRSARVFPMGYGIVAERPHEQAGTLNGA